MEDEHIPEQFLGIVDAGNPVIKFQPSSVQLLLQAIPYLHTTNDRNNRELANWLASPDVIVVNIVREGFKTFFGR